MLIFFLLNPLFDSDDQFITKRYSTDIQTLYLVSMCMLCTKYFRVLPALEAKFKELTDVCCTSAMFIPLICTCFYFFSKKFHYVWMAMPCGMH